MVNSILRHVNQPERNNAGGPTHTIDKWNRLNRFLIIGTEGGTFYVAEREHTIENVKAVLDCLADDPERTVQTIAAISEAGRSPKNDYAIFALACATMVPSARTAAYNAIPVVCRTGTHILQFAQVVNSMRGWGSGLRRAIAKWYTDKTPDDLAYQVLKYPNRHGWTHRDLLRKVHPTTTDPALNAVLAHVAGKQKPEQRDVVPEIILAWDDVQHGFNSPDMVADVIRGSNLTREMIPTHFLTDPDVLYALVEKMPYIALMRNLGNLTRHGVITPVTVHSIMNRLAKPTKLVHPLSILTAHQTYTSGSGVRSTSSWTPLDGVGTALDTAFYRAFENVAPTGKRFRIGVDVSGSMSGNYGSVLSPYEIAAALSLVIARTETRTEVFAFDTGLRRLPRFDHGDITLGDAMLEVKPCNYGGTDAALLIDDARANRVPVDVFVSITDNETWVRDRKPSDAIKEYRAATGIDAKLIVLATTATEFSIADPNDPGMLDIAGFDSSVPEIMREFVLGNI